MPDFEWVSVTERLPKKNIHVLAIVDKYNPRPVCIKYLGDGKWDCDRRETTIAYCLYGDGGHLEPLFESTHVTHWMPLPEVPKVNYEEI